MKKKIEEIVEKKEFNNHFQPKYNPWEQRIPVSIGLKKIIKEKQINIITGEIRAFNQNGVTLTNGKKIKADLVVLATGFNLEFFKFDVFLNKTKVDTQRINFYKGMMMGGIPNYFQPIGTWHTSWTQRSEVVSSLIAKIIAHMKSGNLDKVQIDRKKVDKKNSISPNYIKRNLSKIPVL